MDMKNKGILLILFTALVSGFSIFLNSFGVKGFDSSVFTFSKNVIAALFLFSAILGVSKFNEFKKLDRKNWLSLAIIGLIGGSIPFLLFFKGLQMTTGTTSAFIHKTMFIYVSILALVFLKERLSNTAVLGALLLLAGTYFMLLPDLAFSAGHLLILGATIFWAIENVYAKHVLKQISGTMVAFGRMFFGSLFILIFLAFTDKLGTLIAMSMMQYGWILLTSLLLFLYVFSYYNGLKHVKVSTAACILTIGAPITSLLSFVFRGTSMSLSTAFGILLIFTGAGLVVWLSQRPQPVEVYDVESA